MSTPSSAANTGSPLIYSLTFQLFIGLLLGTFIGIIWPHFAAQLNPLASAFVKLIKMVAGLIVFLTVASGLSQIRKGAGLGRLSVVTLIYFEVISTIALVLGLLLGNVFKPGAGLSIPADGAATVASFAQAGQALSTVDFLLNVIPKTVLDALAGGAMLQILLVALLFGYALFALGERAEPLAENLRLWTEVSFKVVSVILRFAPIGVFAAVAFTIGKFGLAALLPLIKMIGLVYLGCTLMILLVFASIARLTGFSLWRFIKLIHKELIIAFTTTSSEAALPGLMTKLQEAGCSKNVTGFVVPAGYSFNLDGSSIYLTVAALFIAQAAGLDLGWSEQLSLLLVFLLTSKGVAGVSGGAFVTLAASLTMFPDIPLAGLALILGVDRLMDTMRTLTNVLGNGVATMAIARWMGQRNGDDQAHAARTESGLMFQSTSDSIPTSNPVA
ncbi:MULTISPECIES: cation:dicarboxylase symporter family transporter [unclassified Pseudomonas]|uniref:cation:dicarboxylate symporter family transporter n=1 Tax=unclassified Pseudomonas TaxID=196821 RepID=UPI00128CD2D6|nr:MULTISPECIES: cation:dicarboxylase symporter family transporter [unclassified Pseudomonas]MPQ66619.1 cation:dicarboxylase symporter family transporter [Pseudomonas sp. MWU12-2323]